MPKHIAHQAGIFRRVFRDSMNGGLIICFVSSNSIAPRIGSGIVSFTTTARRIPVIPRKIKICLQFTSSSVAPIKEAVTKYAAIIPSGIPIE